MKLATQIGLEWRAALCSALEIGRAGPLDADQMIDQALRGEWSGLWW